MNKRQKQYRSNKNRELNAMKIWQEKNKKDCPMCGVKIRYRSHFCKHCAQIDQKSSSWKGNNAGYVAIHQWVSKKLGKPNSCISCGTTQAKRFDWANISGEYKRDLSDWIRLCRSCHWKIDTKNGLGKSLKIFPERKTKGKTW